MTVTKETYQDGKTTEMDSAKYNANLPVPKIQSVDYSEYYIGVNCPGNLFLLLIPIAAMKAGSARHGILTGIWNMIPQIATGTARAMENCPSFPIMTGAEPPII